MSKFKPVEIETDASMIDLREVIENDDSESDCCSDQSFRYNNPSGDKEPIRFIKMNQIDASQLKIKVDKI